MQPSRMFNHSAMHEADLMREISAMRLAEQALQTSEPRVRRHSRFESLAFHIANWRRLSGRRFYREQELAHSAPRPQEV